MNAKTSSNPPQLNQAANKAPFPCKLRLLTISTLFHFSGAVFATGTEGSKTPEGVPDLETVVVTAPRPPLNSLNSTEVEGKDISAKRAYVSDTAKLLEDIPGVSLYGAGGLSSLPVLHGLNDDRVKVEVNGMTVTSSCANHMNPPLSYIDRSNVGKISVTAGVTPVSLGGDSIGGTIVVTSPDPVFAEPGKGILLGGSLSSFYRSNGDAFGGSIAAAVANENVRLDYTGSHTESGNYQDGNGNDVKSTSYESQNHAATLSAKYGDHLFVIKGGQQHMPYQNFPNARMDLTGNDSIFGNITHQGKFDWGRLETKFYIESTRHSMNIGDDKQAFAFPPPNNLMPMDTRGRNLGYTIKADIPLTERDTLHVGNEYHDYRLNDYWPPVHGNSKGPTPAGMYFMMAPQTFWNINNGERGRVGTYAEWEARWTERWETLLGLRYDHTGTDAGDVQPYNPLLLGGANAAGAGISLAAAKAFNAKDHSRANDTFDVTALAHFRPDEMSHYEFGYARKNRVPNLYERYTWGRRNMDMAMNGWFGDGNGYIGNLDLEPETANTVSLTAEFHEPANFLWQFKATPYFTYVENFIDVDRCPVYLGGACTASNLKATNSFVYLQYANHDAWLSGVDVSGSAHIYSHKAFGDFSATTVMSYVHGERTDGVNLYHMMPFNMKTSLNHKLGGWLGALEMQFVDAKDDVQSVRNETQTPSYILFNSRGSYQWGKVRLDVGVDNIFNKQYYHPLAGAYLGDRFGMNPTGPAATTVPYGRNVAGMGRSVYVGLNVTY